MPVADNGNSLRSIFQPAPFNVVGKCHLRNPPTIQNLIIYFQSTFSIPYIILTTTSVWWNIMIIKQKRSGLQMERLHKIMEFRKDTFFFNETMWVLGLPDVDKSSGKNNVILRWLQIQFRISWFPHCKVQFNRSLLFLAQ